MILSYKKIIIKYKIKHVIIISNPFAAYLHHKGIKTIVREYHIWPLSLYRKANCSQDQGEDKRGDT